MNIYKQYPIERLTVYFIVPSAFTQFWTTIGHDKLGLHYMNNGKKWRHWSRTYGTKNLVNAGTIINDQYNQVSKTDNEKLP